VIACYCRVSSARQKTDSQKPEIRRWLDGNRIDPSAVGWFEDKETGKTLKRPAFDRLRLPPTFLRKYALRTTPPCFAF
jgi:DNA invertase Pin-like site-specific DNA recombinase